MKIMSKWKKDKLGQAISQAAIVVTSLTIIDTQFLSIYYQGYSNDEQEKEEGTSKKITCSMWTHASPCSECYFHDINILI